MARGGEELTNERFTAGDAIPKWGSLRLQMIAGLNSFRVKGRFFILAAAGAAITMFHFGFSIYDPIRMGLFLSYTHRIQLQTKNIK